MAERCVEDILIDSLPYTQTKQNKNNKCNKIKINLGINR